jgi:hypothetical protein
MEFLLWVNFSHERRIFPGGGWLETVVSDFGRFLDPPAFDVLYVVHDFLDVRHG